MAWNFVAAILALVVRSGILSFVCVACDSAAVLAGCAGLLSSAVEPSAPYAPTRNNTCVATRPAFCGVLAVQCCVHNVEFPLCNYTNSEYCVGVDQLTVLKVEWSAEHGKVATESLYHHRVQ